MTDIRLELEDIQSGVLRPRPSPYAATYLLFRIDQPNAGREFLRRLLPLVPSAAHPESPERDTWVSIAVTFGGLQVLGVPESSLESFAPEFKQGMVARAALLKDLGESAPENWEKPLGSSEVHLVVTAVAPTREQRDETIRKAREAFDDIKGVTRIWRQDCHAHADGKEDFGFKDGISHPAVEGSGIPGTNPLEVPLKAGEFVLGYPDEVNEKPALPQPEILGRNGSYVVFRKLHQRVASFRNFLKANAANPDEEEFVAAKMMGRWRSGAPLALCPFHDNPELGADPQRNNAFLFQEEDAIGYKTPGGSHIRRMNPRDADVAGIPRIHRMIRRGTSYGTPLQAGVLEDDGQDRGLMFAFVGAHLGRQFEFVQAEWANDGTFFDGGSARDPITGASENSSGTFDIPKCPIRKRLQGIPRFVVVRGGEYCFLPSLRALKWLSELDTEVCF